MTGHNEMHLNTATMKQVVQEWLDRNLTSPNQMVDGVEWDGGGRTFVVSLRSKEDAE